MSTTKKPSARNQRVASKAKSATIGVHIAPQKPAIMGGLVEDAQSAIIAIVGKSRPGLEAAAVGKQSAAVSDELRIFLEDMTEKIRSSTLINAGVLQGRGTRVEWAHSHRPPLTAIAENMEQSIAALGPALAEIETPVSPQLARSMAATERAWRELENDFGLLTSLEVSEIVGSKSPNRSYASEQRSKGKLIAVKRPGGLRYPGFQIDRAEHAIRPVMAELIDVAESAGRSESSLALWMTSRTGYLDGDRPVDHLSQPDRVVEAAAQSFGVQW